MYRAPSICCLFCFNVLLISFIWSMFGSFFIGVFHAHLFFFLGPLVRLWSDKRKTSTWTTTSRGTLSPSTKALRCSRLRRTWRRTTCPTSEITAGKRGRRVSTSSSIHTIHSLFPCSFMCLSCVVLPVVSPRNRPAVRCQGVQGRPDAQEGGVDDHGQLQGARQTK